jgi:hypothetical protein
MQLRRFILEGCRGRTVTRNFGIYRKIKIVAICSVIRTGKKKYAEKMWNVLRKDVVHIVTTVISSSVSRVRICDFLWNMKSLV